MEPEEGILGLELSFQRVEKDLLLRVLGLSFLKALVHLLVALALLVEVIVSRDDMFWFGRRYLRGLR